MSLQTKNSCAKAFGNRSREQKFKAKKIEGGVRLTPLMPSRVKDSSQKMLFSKVLGISSLCISWTFEDLQAALRCPFLPQLLQVTFLARHNSRLWKSLLQK